MIRRDVVLIFWIPGRGHWTIGRLTYCEAHRFQNMTAFHEHRYIPLNGEIPPRTKPFGRMYIPQPQRFLAAGLGFWRHRPPAKWLV